jgi:glucosamine-6-phosphate isomerase
MISHLQFPDYESMSDNTADIIADAIQANPALVLCMASGHTPARTCDLLVAKIIVQGIECSNLTFIGLDEWVGLPGNNEGSCRYFFQHKIFRPLQVDPSQYYLFDGMADDLESELRKMNELILKHDIDLMVVGIGMNGHIGFNEPGTPFTSLCHVADLDEMTTSVGQKYFKDETKLSRGITVGLGHLMNAKHLVLIANGVTKAAVIQRALEGPIDPLFPASIIQKHENVTVITDFDAASLLGKS